eukprot:m.156816 g.156816  ORF g.156816 m.156816 type:complete len:218 (+) comp17950_c0_seq6:803-1456(+)
MSDGTRHTVFAAVSNDHQLELMGMLKEGKTQEQIFRQAQIFRKEELAAGIDSSKKKPNELCMRKRTPSLSQKLGERAKNVLGKARTRLSSLSSVKLPSARKTKSKSSYDTGDDRRRRARPASTSRSESDMNTTAESAPLSPKTSAPAPIRTASAPPPRPMRKVSCEDSAGDKSDSDEEEYEVADNGCNRVAIVPTSRQASIYVSEEEGGNDEYESMD